MQNKEFIDFITGYCANDAGIIEIRTVNGKRYQEKITDYTAKDGKYIITAVNFSDGTNRINVQYFEEELPGAQAPGTLYLEVENGDLVYASIEK